MSLFGGRTGEVADAIVAIAKNTERFDAGSVFSQTPSYKGPLGNLAGVKMEDDPYKYAMKKSPYILSLKRELLKTAAVTNPKDFVRSRAERLKVINAAKLQQFNEWWKAQEDDGRGLPEIEAAAEQKLRNLYGEALTDLNFDYPMDALSVAVAQEVKGAQNINLGTSSVKYTGHYGTKSKGKGKGKGKKK